MKINFGEQFIEKNEPITVYDAAAEAGIISRAVVAAKVNGVVCALTTPITADADVTLLTFEDEDGKHVFRHTASHILAQAVKRLYPDAKLAIGPAVDNGFYYDIDSEVQFTPADLTKIEGEMKKIVKERIKLERSEMPRAEAIAFMESKNEPYKVELINDLPEGEEISFFKQGDFTELCAGPHVTYTSAVKALPFTVTAPVTVRFSTSAKLNAPMSRLQRLHLLIRPTSRRVPVRKSPAALPRG